MRQTGGKGQYGHAVIALEPLERGAGVEFESKIVGGSVPREFWRAIEQGIRDALTGGIVAGYPVIDLKATLIDGSFHEVDSSRCRSRSPAAWPPRMVWPRPIRRSWSR